MRRRFSLSSLTWRGLTLACAAILVTLAGGCRTFQRTASADSISGPGAMAVVGSSLFVTDDFSRTLRRIDLKTGDNDRVPLPESIHIFDLSDDGQGGLFLADSGSVWRLTLPAGELQLVAGSRSHDLAPQDGRPAPDVWLFPRGGLHRSAAGAAVFSARGIWSVGPDRVLKAAYRPAASFVGAGRLCLEHPSRVHPMDLAIAPDGDLFVACWGDYAADHRILRVELGSGEVTTVVGPGTPLASESVPSGSPWRLRWPRGLSFDQRGGLAFIDGGSNSLMLLDLATGRLDRLASGFKHAADVASDEDGNLYISDYETRRVLAFDRRRRSLRTIARVGGSREAGFRDGVIMADEPSYAECENSDTPGYLEVTARIPGGDPYPLTRVYRIEGEMNVPAVANSEGVARFTIEESREYLFVVDAPGFKPQSFRYRLSRSCTARVDVTLEWQALY